MQLSLSLFATLALFVVFLVFRVKSDKYFYRMRVELYDKLPKDIPFHTVEWPPKMIQTYIQYCGHTENLKLARYWNKAAIITFAFVAICWLFAPFG